METASLKFKHIIELASKELTVINRPYKVLLLVGLKRPGSKEPWCSLYENASKNMFVFHYKQAKLCYLLNTVQLSNKEYVIALEKPASYIKRTKSLKEVKL